jgi:hypothetical protein
MSCEGRAERDERGGEILRRGRGHRVREGERADKEMGERGGRCGERD